MLKDRAIKIATKIVKAKMNEESAAHLYPLFNKKMFGEVKKYEREYWRHASKISAERTTITPA